MFITAGKTKTLKLKNNKKKVKWSVVSGKSKVKLKAKTKKSVKIVGKKKGYATVRAKVGKKKYSCRVCVKVASETVKPAMTQKPATTPSGSAVSPEPLVSTNDSESRPSVVYLWVGTASGDVSDPAAGIINPATGMTPTLECSQIDVSIGYDCGIEFMNPYNAAFKLNGSYSATYLPNLIAGMIAPTMVVTTKNGGTAYAWDWNEKKDFPSGQKVDISYLKGTDGYFCLFGGSDTLIKIEVFDNAAIAGDTTPSAAPVQTLKPGDLGDTTEKCIVTGTVQTRGGTTFDKNLRAYCHSLDNGEVVLDKNDWRYYNYSIRFGKTVKAGGGESFNTVAEAIWNEDYSQYSVALDAGTYDVNISMGQNTFTIENVSISESMTRSFTLDANIITGKLYRGGNQPIVGEPVEVYQKEDSSGNTDWKYSHMIYTGPDGEFLDYVSETSGTIKYVYHSIDVKEVSLNEKDLVNQIWRKEIYLVTGDITNFGTKLSDDLARTRRLYEDVIGYYDYYQDLYVEDSNQTVYMQDHELNVDWDQGVFELYIIPGTYYFRKSLCSSKNALVVTDRDISDYHIQFEGYVVELSFMNDGSSGYDIEKWSSWCIQGDVPVTCFDVDGETKKLLVPTGNYEIAAPLEDSLDYEVIAMLIVGQEDKKLEIKY